MKGYEKMATLTAEFPELLVLRRFDRLSARMLLRMQAEMLYLEHELDAFIQADETDHPEITTYYEKLSDAKQQETLLLHLDKYAEVEEKLKTYHETVLRISQMRQLPSPSRNTRSSLRTWLSWKHGGNNFLQSIEADPWYTEELKELLTVSHQGDRLDQWLSDAATPVYHNVCGHRAKPNVDTELGLGPLYHYQLRWLHLLGNGLCVAVSCLVPIASIQGLYWLPTSLDRLSLITALIVLFAIVLMFLTDCRRSDVFVGTSAFAAVMVVFLQGLNGAINTSARG